MKENVCLRGIKKSFLLKCGMFLIMLLMFSHVCWAAGDTYKVVVETGYLALRDAKGYDYNNEIGELYTGEYVEVLDRSDDTYWWVYSSKYDTRGYVNKNYLVKEETSAAKNASKTYKVVVESGYLALRNAKGYDSNNEIGELYTGEYVEVLDQSDDTYWWVYSSKYDTRGYVNKNYLVKTETSAGKSTSTIDVSDLLAKILAQTETGSSGNYDSYDDYSTAGRSVLEENTLSAVIDGEEVIFYLVEADTDNWLVKSGGDSVYYAQYAAYDGAGKRKYAFYMEISDRVSGNSTYSYSDDMVFRFRFSTMPDNSGDFQKQYRLWRGKIYNDDHYSNYGSFSLTLGDCSSLHLKGTLDCELTYSRYSSSAEDGYYYDTSDVVTFRDIQFDFTIGTVHPVADDYEMQYEMNGGSASVSGNINTYSSYNEGENDNSGSTWTKQLTRDCLRCGTTGECPICHGDGKGIVRGGEYGPSDCDFCVDGKCSACYGKGWVYN